MTFTELLTRMVWQAQRGGPKFETAEEDAIAIAEAVFPQIATTVSRFAAASPYTRPLLQRTVSITFTNGEGALPAQVLVAYVNCDSSFLDPASTVKRYSYLQWSEFIRRPAGPLGYYTVLGEERLLQREPNAMFTIGAGASGSRQLTTPCIVQRPAVATDSMDCVPEIETMLINTGAEALRSEILSKAVMA